MLIRDPCSALSEASSADRYLQLTRFMSARTASTSGKLWLVTTSRPHLDFFTHFMECSMPKMHDYFCVPLTATKSVPLVWCKGWQPPRTPNARWSHARTFQRTNFTLFSPGPSKTNDQTIQRPKERCFLFCATPGNIGAYCTTFYSRTAEHGGT